MRIRFGSACDRAVSATCRGYSSLGASVLVTPGTRRLSALLRPSPNAAGLRAGVRPKSLAVVMRSSPPRGGAHIHGSRAPS